VELHLDHLTSTIRHLHIPGQDKLATLSSDTLAAIRCSLLQYMIGGVRHDRVAGGFIVLQDEESL
jgi:hypothetical protein